jgi:hypothetical protein
MPQPVSRGDIYIDIIIRLLILFYNATIKHLNSAMVENIILYIKLANNVSTSFVIANADTVIVVPNQYKQH